MSNSNIDFDQLVKVEGEDNNQKLLSNQVTVKDYNTLNIATKNMKNIKKSIDVDNAPSDHNWTDINTQTLRNWKISLQRAMYIYDYVYDNLNNKLRRIKICIICFSVLIFIAGGISTAMLAYSNTNNIIVLVFAIIITAFEGVNIGLASVNQLYGWDQLLSSYAVYQEKLDNLNSTIASQLILPEELREDAISFIKKEHDTYLALIKVSPKLSTTDHKMALKEYNDFLEGNSLNFRLAQKYSSDAMIDVS